MQEVIWGVFEICLFNMQNESCWIPCLVPHITTIKDPEYSLRIHSYFTESDLDHCTQKKITFSPGLIKQTSSNYEYMCIKKELHAESNYILKVYESKFMKNI